MFAKIFTYSWHWIVKPGQATENLLYEDKRAQIGFWTILIFAFLYSITALILWLTGFQPFFKTVLPIPDESYYLWQTFFTIPWGIATWFLTGAVIHLWNRIFTKQRRLSDILGHIGYAFAIPWFFFTWLPETFVAPFLGQWGFPPWPMWIEFIRIIIPAVWMGTLFYIAVYKVYEARWLRSLTSAFLGTAVLVVMFFLFLR
ncbi:hypothetical protein GF338_03795 [candidate division WOR-3 bacterium]|nr:hypothetical protein [candidate division WOR-3 bacterium]